MPNKIDDLRAHLFETLEGLKDKDKPMDLDRARAVADVAKVIVESAKVEVQFLKVTGALESTNFLPSGEKKAGAAVAPAASVPPKPVPVERQIGGKKFDVVFDGSRDQSLIGERPSRARG